MSRSAEPADQPERPGQGLADPFGTAERRHRLIEQWAASPLRFREDANSEQDHALGGYRGRAVVELAQNAADAAARAGVPGRLLLTLAETADGGVLVAANTGAALDADGVDALASLRASAKRDQDAVGRFGVGFCAVLELTEEPVLLSAGRGVRFSAAETRTLVARAAAGVPALGEELARRDGAVPVLRLPFPAVGEAPEGYRTAVLLPLRDADAMAAAQRQLEQVDDTLLLALPALAEVGVQLPGRPLRVLREVHRRWRVHRRSGLLAEPLLAGRPVEERSRRAWQVTWALPRPGPHAPDGGLAVPQVLHAPTASAEPLHWPGLLVATFPMDPSRRHLVPGPLTDQLTEHAATAWVELMEQVATAGEPVWELVPTGLPGGALDAALRARVADLAPAAALLPAAQDRRLLVRGRDAVALEGSAGADEQVVGALADLVAGLVRVPTAARAAAGVLGVHRVRLADLVEQLPAAGSPAAWRQRYQALAALATDPDQREALSGLPVPLADGRTVRSPRGCVLTDPLTDPHAARVAAALARLGVRTVHPDAAHPLLLRLGAQQVGPRQAVLLPAVRAAVQASPDAEDPQQVADAVLDLLAVLPEQDATPVAPWVADLALPDEDGELAPAGALALPGSRAAAWLDPREIGVVDPALVRRWGEQVLARAGVLTGLVVVRVDELAVEEPGQGPELDQLAGVDRWLADVRQEVSAAGLPLEGAWIADLEAVHDLELVTDRAWPQVLAAVASEQPLREAVTRPARVQTAAGALEVCGLTAWWLRRRFLPAGAAALPEAEEVLAGVLPAAPPVLAQLARLPALPVAARAALGLFQTVPELTPGAVPALVAGLARADAEPGVAGLVRLWHRLAELAACAPQVPSPPGTWAVRRAGGSWQAALCEPEAVLTVEAPCWLQLPGYQGFVLAPRGGGPALAELLDLPWAGEARPTTPGRCRPVPPVVAGLLPAAPRTWQQHQRLRVEGESVDWWVEGEGGQALLHACSAAGLARGLAWAAGAWSAHPLLAQVLAHPDPATVAAVGVELAFSASSPAGAPGLLSPFSPGAGG